MLGREKMSVTSLLHVVLILMETRLTYVRDIRNQGSNPAPSGAMRKFIDGRDPRKLILSGPLLYYQDAVTDRLSCHTALIFKNPINDLPEQALLCSMSFDWALDHVGSDIHMHTCSRTTSRATNHDTIISVCCTQSHKRISNAGLA